MQIVWYNRGTSLLSPQRHTEVERPHNLRDYSRGIGETIRHHPVPDLYWSTREVMRVVAPRTIAIELRRLVGVTRTHIPIYRVCDHPSPATFDGEHLANALGG